MCPRKRRKTFLTLHDFLKINFITLSTIAAAAITSIKTTATTTIERECGLSEIMELSMDTPVQRQVIDAQYSHVRPVGPVKDASEIEFLVPNDSYMFINLYGIDYKVSGEKGKR